VRDFVCPPATDGRFDPTFPVNVSAEQWKRWGVSSRQAQTAHGVSALCVQNQESYSVDARPRAVTSSTPTSSRPTSASSYTSAAGDRDTRPVVAGAAVRGENARLPLEVLAAEFPRHVGRPDRRRVCRFELTQGPDDCRAPVCREYVES